MQRLWPRSVLSACREPKAVTQFHAQMLLSGLSNHVYSISQLITLYGKTCDISSAQLVFDQTPQKEVSLWNALITAYSRNNSYLEVLKLFQCLISVGIRPDSTTFTVSLRACAYLFDLKTGEEILSQVIRSGYKGDVFVASSALNLYAKCGWMTEATKLFDEMKEKDVISWTTLISGFAQSGKAVEAISVYRKMKEEGIEEDAVVMVGLAQASSNLRDLKLGLSVHGRIIRREIVMDVVTQTGLVDMYGKNGNLNLASRVFGMMIYKNVISWGALISGFAQNGFTEEALELVIEMQDCGLQPDKQTLVSALLACAHVGHLKFGKSIHGVITRRLDIDPVSGTAVIDMYSKCGCLSSARTLFDRAKLRDSISWNSMITGYGVHGDVREALSLFHQMTDTELRPTDATFASLLSALSHSGLVKEGQHWFNLMVSEYQIEPSEKHYACMVDLLARAGNLEEAFQLIKSMNVEPEITVLVALLSSCCTYGNLDIGEMIAKQVLQLEPKDPGIYALVSNIFALAQKWDEVAKVRKMIEEVSLRKMPGHSTVEVGRKLRASPKEDRCPGQEVAHHFGYGDYQGSSYEAVIRDFFCKHDLDQPELSLCNQALI
ncbi:hypothetical protein H6P81_014045 [Aristolochia fimbriata]|uniref:Pentatricopeptide repeat-containing protein n=1 Tax=Aristolochia fimbriata TaxID=158543 RepID=A0AAV7EJP2_ARIFI|nr:hypothetical protein H6P81_014045 [Aristolochia fimbriata]